MKDKIRFKDVYNYLEGNARMVLAKFNRTPVHIQEQVEYRLEQCKDDCFIVGRCKECSCPLPNRAFTTETCNNKRFPDLMDPEAWEEFKKKMNG
jgi:hypothetical protein